MLTIEFEEGMKAALKEIIKVISWASQLSTADQLTVIDWIQSVTVSTLGDGPSEVPMIDADNRENGSLDRPRCVMTWVLWVDRREERPFRIELYMINGYRGWKVYKWRSRASSQYYQIHCISNYLGLDTKRLTLVNRLDGSQVGSSFFYFPYRTLEAQV